MLLGGYTTEIFRPECNPSFTSVHCLARLDADIADVLPYLNQVLGGTHYMSDPPQVMFHHQGRIIKVGAREIAINALTDADEAERILAWLKEEINRTWENRESIEPCFTGRTKPQVMQILRLLPKTNCRRCGLPTCMVFAAQTADGGRGAADCPELTEENRHQLAEYLAGFDFD